MQEQPLRLLVGPSGSTKGGTPRQFQFQLQFGLPAEAFVIGGDNEGLLLSMTLQRTISGVKECFASGGGYSKHLYVIP